jgi:two-component system LytT family response regulator
MINCIVVDDEEHAIDVIRHYLKQIPTLNLIASFTNPIEALAELDDLDIDLVFLDINMPQLSGIEFLQLTRGKYQVIVTTADKEVGQEWYKFEGFNYLIKPIVPALFLQAVALMEKCIIQKRQE